MTGEEITLRRLLWLYHGCPSPALYGDDGEMQCNNFEVHGTTMDFKRDTVEMLEEKLVAPEYRKVFQLMKNPEVKK